MAPSRTTRSEDFALAYEAHARSITEATGYLVTAGIRPNGRRGVLEVVVRASHAVDGRPAGTYLQRRSEWPNAGRVDLCAHLLAEVMKLDHDIELETQRAANGLLAAG